MKANRPRSFIPLLFLFSVMSSHAQAADSFSQDSEARTFDQAPALTVQEESRILSTPDVIGTSAVDPALQAEASKRVVKRGKWAFKFELVKDNGDHILLSEQNVDEMLIPASAQKTFTGWYAYKNLPQFTKATISHMLHKSDGQEADAMYAAAGGFQPILDYLKNDNGLDFSKTLVMVDGTGLDDKTNRTNVQTLHSLVNYIHASADYPNFRDMLAQPDEDSTLKDEGRLKDLSGMLYAKTGTMPKTRVASLVGYVETAQGILTFSMIGNAYFREAPYAISNRYTALDKAREIIDNMVRLHTNWLKTHTLVETTWPAIFGWSPVSPRHYTSVPIPSRRARGH